MSIMSLPSTTINGQQIRFEFVQAQDLALISNFLLCNFFSDQPLFRDLGIGERLRQALATPDSKEAEEFMRETHEYFRRKLVGPIVEAVPKFSFKAVCESNGELIGVVIGRVLELDASAGNRIQTEYVSH